MLFPTRVGVFPGVTPWFHPFMPFPHASGGGPEYLNSPKRVVTLFPTRVGVFPR